MTLRFQQVAAFQDAEKKLLFLAEPEVSLVERYLVTGICFRVLRNERCLGVLVACEKKQATLEIMNLAIQEEQQNQGIGSAFLTYLKKWARAHDYQTLEIATGSTTFPALALYQKQGFRITEIVPDYFTRHYHEPLYEFGILLRDQVRLQLSLDEKTD